MNRKWPSLQSAILLVGAIVFLNGCASAPVESESKGSGHGVAAEQAPPKGPHGGRVLDAGDAAIEVTIFESGVPPEYRVYVLKNGQTVDPSGVDLGIELKRLAGRTDTIGFVKQGDFLRSDQVVEEPHSFDVTVRARIDGKDHEWKYPSYEGRVEMIPEVLASAGIEVESVGPAKIERRLTTHGRIVPDADREAHVIPRFAGVVKSVNKRLGDKVSAGELLAVVQSNESFQPYEVRSPLGGTIITKDVAPGEFAPEGESIFTVLDSSEVWAELQVYRQDLGDVKVGQDVTIRGGETDAQVVGRIANVSTVGNPASQTLTARVEIPNSSGAWLPGWFVTGEILVEETTVPLAAKLTALQTFRDWDVVFLADGNVFEVRPLELGRRDTTWVEILGGILPGQKYVTGNSFLVKADLGKSGASHDH